MTKDQLLFVCWLDKACKIRRLETHPMYVPLSLMARKVAKELRELGQEVDEDDMIGDFDSNRVGVCNMVQ